VEITLTNLLIDAETETVLLVGGSVPLEATIVVFLLGFSVMEKTTAETVLMNLIQITVPSAITTETSSAGMEDASPSDGDVTLRTIVETTLMKTVLCARISIENALKVNSSVETKSVFPLDGGAIMTMTAMMDPMRRIVKTTSARQISSSANQDTVFLEGWSVMVTRIAEMYLTK
jgi:hypothetical protein